MDSFDNSGIPMLRHAVATLAYRAGKTFRNVPAGFDSFRAAPVTRSAIEIVAHIGDLLDWAGRAADGDISWRPSCRVRGTKKSRGSLRH
jgi:hypothetical protein